MPNLLFDLKWRTIFEWPKRHVLERDWEDLNDHSITQIHDIASIHLSSHITRCDTLINAGAQNNQPWDNTFTFCHDKLPRDSIAFKLQKYNPMLDNLCTLG